MGDVGGGRARLYLARTWRRCHKQSRVAPRPFNRSILTFVHPSVGSTARDIPENAAKESPTVMSAPRLTIQFEKVYDLSVPTYSGMQMHPAEEAAGARTLVQRQETPEGLPLMCGGGPGPAPGWPIYHDLEFTTHTGTHIDAPWHFNQEGRRIDQYPPEVFMGTGVVLDFRHFDDKARITGEDLARARPAVQEGDILLINTGRHRQFGSREYATLHPGLDGEACERFLLEKRIRMVGMDTICVEPGSEEDHWAHPLHRICLIENEILLIENLGGQIDAVTGKRCYIVALPLKLQADAAPARVIALV